MPFVASFNDIAADRHAETLSLCDRLESEAMRECESLNALAAPLYAALDAHAQERIRADLYDMAMTQILARPPIPPRQRPVR